MSKQALYAGVGAAVVAVVAVVTGLVDLDRLRGRDVAPQSAALVAPDTNAPGQPKAPAAPEAALAPAAEGSEKPDLTQPSTGQEAKPEVEREADAKVEPTAEQQAEVQPKAAEPTDEASAKAAPDPSAPRFDLVRAEPGGSTLVAGAGAPGATIEVMVNGTRAADTQIGADGRFVVFLDLATGAQAQVVTLLQRQGGREIPSDEEVIIAPAPVTLAQSQPKAATHAALDQEKAQTEAAVVGEAAAQVATPDATVQSEPSAAVDAADEAPVTPDATGPVVEAGAPQAGQLLTSDPAVQSVPSAQVLDARLGDTSAEVATPKTPSAEAATAARRAAPEVAAAASAPQPPAVLLSSSRGVEVLQSAPLAPGDVALDAISYDETGEVYLSGRGDEAAFVRVYLDNTPITTSRIRDDGRWRVSLPEVDTGTYTLRVDQLGESGAVTARVESPFLRESAAILEAAQKQGPVTAITVQPGNTLWAIARDRYGEGLDYVKVFEANRERIRDPDLIYPGQIFDLPQN